MMKSNVWRIQTHGMMYNSIQNQKVYHQPSTFFSHFCDLKAALQAILSTIHAWNLIQKKKQSNVCTSSEFQSFEHQWHGRDGGSLVVFLVGKRRFATMIPGMTNYFGDVSHSAILVIRSWVIAFRSWHPALRKRNQRGRFPLMEMQWDIYTCIHIYIAFTTWGIAQRESSIIQTTEVLGFSRK